MTSHKYIIMKALHLTELQYGQLVYNYAFMWMERYFGNQECIKEAFHHSKHFWKWWVGQWNNRDTEFLQMVRPEKLATCSPEALKEWRRLYLKHHNVDELKILPNRMVSREVGKLIKIEEAKLKLLLQNT